MNQMPIRIVFAAGFSALLVSPAHAEALILGGGEYGVSSSYGYLGAVVPFRRLGSGLAVRLWGDYLGYDYPAGPSMIEASAWGGEISAVYQFSGGWGWSNISVGGRYRDTQLSPDDLGNAARGARVYLTGQIDGGLNIGPRWRLRGVANYTATIDGYFAQPALERAISDSVRIGVDATFQGDKSYKQVGAGLSLAVALDPRRSITIRGGASDNGSETGAYGGLSFAWMTN